MFRKDEQQDIVRIDALWDDFSKYLVLMFGSMEQALSFHGPPPFEEDSEDTEAARKAIKAQLVSAGLCYFSYASNCVSKLQAVSPGKRKALSVLASALSEYRVMFNGFSGVDAAIKSRQLKKAGDAICSFKEYGAAGDQLLRDGLSMLDKTIDAELIIRLASIHLRWDAQGRITHRLTTELNLDEYQCDDGMAASVPMVINHQLGLLVPSRALWLSGMLLAVLEEEKYAVKPIDAMLKGAQINLLRGSQVFLSFYPYLPPSSYLLTAEDKGNLRIEDGICQLLHSYASYVPQVVSREFVPRIRAWMLIVISDYLESVIAEIQAGSCYPFRPNPNLEAAMTSLSATLYSMCESTGEMPRAAFVDRLQKTRRMYAWVSSHLLR